MTSKYIDFMDGPVADRMISAIRSCPTKTVIELRDQKKISLDDFLLTYKGLDSVHVSAYSSVSGVPARYFFYGTYDKVYPNYTQWDRDVISILDQLDFDAQKIILQYVCDFFPNQFIEDSKEIRRASFRLHARITNLPGKTIAMAKVMDDETISTDLKEELKRFRRGKQSKGFVFDSNLWAELACYFKAPLHWLFSLQVPLYCETQDADLIFDRFVLMQPAQQKSFVRFLRTIAGKET